MAAAGFSPASASPRSTRMPAMAATSAARRSTSSPRRTRGESQGHRLRQAYPSDTVFVRARAGSSTPFTMFHDQGQIAMKLIGFDKGVTLLSAAFMPIDAGARHRRHRRQG
jgi:4-hydroxy-L-threonine phosphate dehydrogenase PdxA